VGLPKDLNVKYVKRLYAGIQDVARRFRVNIVGGDTNASDKLVIAIALLGTCGKHPPVTRSGAQAGDVIFVSGDLGGSYASKKHLNFTPRIAEAQYLVKNYKINSMMDLSDGLSSDIYRLTKASHVGAAILQEAIPVSAKAKHLDAALSEGEDFELLFTLSSKEAARLTLADKPKILATFCPIGKVMPQKYGVQLIKSDGQRKVLFEKGHDHFRG